MEMRDKLKRVGVGVLALAGILAVLTIVILLFSLVGLAVVTVAFPPIGDEHIPMVVCFFIGLSTSVVLAIICAIVWTAGGAAQELWDDMKGR